MKMTRLQVLLLALLGAPSTALGQRVLECKFVSVVPTSFTYAKWSFAADISGGHLAMLLVRPAGDSGSDAPPYVRSFVPLNPGESVFHEVTRSEGEDKAVFVLARLGPGNQVTLDEWMFGNAEDYDRLILTCPAHV